MLRTVLSVIALLGAVEAALAQTVSLDCESGNRNLSSANCWIFPGTDFSATSKIAGNFSARTGQLTGLPNGVITPWLKFSGPTTVTFKHRISENNVYQGRKIEVIATRYVAGTTTFPETVLWSYNYVGGTANTIRSESITIPSSVTGTQRIYFRFTGAGGTARGVIDDILFTGNVKLYGDPANNCLPIVEAPPAPQYLDTKLSQTGNYSLLFEDMWPAYGDYDFNDLVLDYNWTITASTAPGNFVTKAIYTFKLRAMGAGNNNGFGFQLNGISPSAITSVKGTRITGSLHRFNTNGTEAAQGAATIIVFDQGKAVMNDPQRGFVNTSAAGALITPVTLTVEVAFAANANIGLASLQQAFNPFLVVAQQRGREVHLMSGEPTSLADRSLFGTRDDKSNNGKTYRAKNNSSWALQVPVSIPYVQERQLINKAFLKFTNWVDSGGSQFADWYSDKAGYRNASYLLTNK